MTFEWFASDTSLIQLLYMPVLIFLARICDVSLGTLRIMYVTRGYRLLSTIAGFLEVTIWIYAAGQVLSNLSSFVHVLSYTGGYAAGNFVGGWIEEKLSFGNLMLRVFVKKDPELLACRLRDEGYGVTRVPGEGLYGTVDILFTIIKRRDLERTVSIIKNHNPNAVYTVEDVRQVTSPNRPLNGLTPYSFSGAASRFFMVPPMKRGKTVS